MSVQALTLPLDITWRRLAFARDMVDTNFGDLLLPPKWRSSLAVYQYVVPEEQTAESHPDARIVYLNVSCSITGWNPSEEIRGAVDVGEENEELDDLQRSTWQAIQGEGWAAQYWPCLGAILQVAVYPSPEDGEVEPDGFPFVVNVEPKKRELYETRSETGEFLSGTTNQLEIKKGTTDTKSTEESDILTGVSVSGNYGPIGGSASISGEWGTREKTGTETVDMKTTDTSRERRETLSHTTSFSQLYQLLNAYHLGTNRTVFVVAPRPHIVTGETEQVDFNLLDGERRLEGIQDFFLVVEVPRQLRGLCLQVGLDTGHTVRTPMGALKVIRRENEQLPNGERDLPPDYDPSPPGEADDPIPPMDTDSGENIVERLVVTRRIVRACARFNEEGRLEATGPGPTPRGEPDVPIVFEDAVEVGAYEHELLARAGGREDPLRGQRLVADQRNRFIRRVSQSMVSGFTSGDYRPRPFAETHTARALASLTMRRSTTTLDALVDKGLVTAQERRVLRTIDTLGELFDPNVAIITDSAGTAGRTLREVRARVADFVLRPATG